MYIHKKFPHWPVINIDKLSNSGNSETSIDLEGKSNYRFIYGDINDSQLIATIIDRESIGYMSSKENPTVIENDE